MAVNAMAKLKDGALGQTVFFVRYIKIMPYVVLVLILRMIRVKIYLKKH